MHHVNHGRRRTASSDLFDNSGKRALSLPFSAKLARQTKPEQPAFGESGYALFGKTGLLVYVSGRRQGYFLCNRCGGRNEFSPLPIKSINVNHGFLAHLLATFIIYLDSKSSD